METQAATSENLASSAVKAQYRVTNGPEYDRALVQRGSLTVGFGEDARQIRENMRHKTAHSSKKSCSTGSAWILPASPRPACARSARWLPGVTIAERPSWESNLYGVRVR